MSIPRYRRGADPITNPQTEEESYNSVYYCIDYMIKHSTDTRGLAVNWQTTLTKAIEYFKDTKIIINIDI